MREYTHEEFVKLVESLTEEELLKFHLQEAMQRVNMGAQPNGFATIIMDELNPDKIKKLKTACHGITVKGDFFCNVFYVYSFCKIFRVIYFIVLVIFGFKTDCKGFINLCGFGNITRVDTA